MTIKGRDTFVAAPGTLNAAYHKDYRSSYLEVYISICSRAGTTPAKDNFCTAFPDLGTIATKFGHARATILEAISWLEKNGYLFRQRRSGASNLYTLILVRDDFLGIWKSEGLEKARAWYLGWLQQQQPR